MKITRDQHDQLSRSIELSPKCGMVESMLSVPVLHPCPDCEAAREAPLGPNRAPGCDLREGAIWERLGGGWRCLYGCYCQSGVSVETHDFTCDRPRDWARTFHPGSVEICLNFSGRARLTREPESRLLGPMSVGLYYCAPDGQLSAWRLPGERHHFITVEYSVGFLQRHASNQEASLHPLVCDALHGSAMSRHTAAPMRLGSRLRKLAESLRSPHVPGSASGLWYQAKALELMAEVFFLPEGAAAETSSRQQELARVRTERAIEILKADLAEPPALEDLGRQVGCSQFYLSRTFSKQMSMTIPQYLRQLRMQKAAELLKSGRFNVTEAALEVGYSSLSHFSQAFCEVMGCCPGLYPLGLVRSSGNKGPAEEKSTAAQAADNK